MLAHELSAWLPCAGPDLHGDCAFFFRVSVTGDGLSRPSVQSVPGAWGSSSTASRTSESPSRPRAPARCSSATTSPGFACRPGVRREAEARPELAGSFRPPASVLAAGIASDRAAPTVRPDSPPPAPAATARFRRVRRRHTERDLVSSPPLTDLTHTWAQLPSFDSCRRAFNLSSSL